MSWSDSWGDDEWVEVDDDEEEINDSILTVPDNPRALGLPHDEWRKYQKETAEWLWRDDLPRIRTMEAATGSGKSSLAMSMRQLGRVVILTRTKSLQTAYGDQYRADILFGKANYRCVHPDAPWPATAEECVEKPTECPYIQRCSYYQAKYKALESRAVCLNYALWFAERGRWPSPDVLVMDEAHLLADLTLEHCGTTIKYATALEWNLPELPELSSGAGGLLIKRPSPIPGAVNWLTKCCGIFEGVANRLRHSFNEDDRERAKKAERYLHNFEAVATALESSDDASAWFIKSGESALRGRDGSEPGFICRPLTAKFHFPGLFLNDPRRKRSLLMSATIGDMNTFAHDELGITGEFAPMYVPNQWPPETRPIYLLKDAPRMSAKATAEDFEKQAELIAKIIKEEADPGWSGIVHVTRISEAKLLGDRLAKLGLGDRIWVPDKSLGGTNQQVKAWHGRLNYVPNSIVCSWCLHEGYDGTRERINIVAKIPFPSRGEAGTYEFELANYSNRVYLQKSARQLVQMCGRTRRGNESDYDTPTERRGLVAIADNSFGMIKKYLSPDILAAITPY